MATPSGVKGQLVNKAGLARLTGKPTKTVDDWIRRGLGDAAAVERGGLAKQWKFDTAAAIEWLVSDRERQADTNAQPGIRDLTFQRARESKERADKYRLENLRTRGEMIHVDEVADYWGKMIGAAKRQQRGIPARLKASGILPDLTLVQAADILALIDESLRELAGTGLPESDRETLEDGLEDMGTAA